MKLFLDTAHINEIEEAYSTGLIDGVTTNPSLVAKTGRHYKDVLTEICNIVDGPISAEVMAENWKGMVDEARELAKIHENIVIKIPMTSEGVLAAKQLVDNGISVNMTLVFSPLQGLICGKLGVDFVSPFVGRLDDIAHTGMDLVGDLLAIYNNYGIGTQIIVASVRNPLHILDGARMGAHIATIPMAVFQQMFKHPLTDIGVEKFKADAAKIPRL